MLHYHPYIIQIVEWNGTNYHPVIHKRPDGIFIVIKAFPMVLTTIQHTVE